MRNKITWICGLFLITFSLQTICEDYCDTCVTNDTVCIKTGARKRLPCLWAQREGKYNHKTPLFSEYGCKNKFIAKHILLNSLRSPLFVASAAITTLSTSPSGGCAGFEFFLTIIASSISIPLGGLKGLLKGFIYDRIYLRNPNSSWMRPRIGYTYSPSFGKDYANSVALFYRFFNNQLYVPDNIEI